MIKFAIFEWKEIEFNSMTMLTSPEDCISKYSVVIQSEDGININVLCLSDGNIRNNRIMIKTYMSNLINSGILKFIDWIENEECSKMMLCDYSSESIEEYLKSLL